MYGGDAGFQWPRENPHISVWILICKHREGFIESPLASMYMTLSEFFDCTKSNQELHGDYSEDLLEARTIFLQAYNTLARLDPLIDVRFAYASRGDATNVSDAVAGRMQQLESLVSEKFSKATVCSSFVGAKELLQLYRKVRDDDFVLPFVSSLTHDENNYVVIATLRDYYNFVKDDEGKLRRYLFDSNVRDFLGYNNVNGDIDYTLKNPSVANFWWLNNGITILANNAHVTGHSLHLRTVQIVNGLQTTETLYRHFAGGNVESLDKNILIKILTSQDVDVRTNIIQATNNQSNVMSYSLHATDDVQRNIEDVLRRENFYYERRDHYYKNEGMPEDRSITPLELAKCFLAVVYLNPAIASKLKNKFMRNSLSYNAVFNSDFPIDKWPFLAALWLDAGKVFRQVYLKKFGDILHPWRPLVAYCVVARMFGKLNFSLKNIVTLKLKDLRADLISEVWEFVAPFMTKFEASSRNKLKKPHQVYNVVIKEFAMKYNLNGVEAVNRRILQRVDQLPTQGVELTEDFIERVRLLLPAQPWKPGMYRDLCARLQVRPSCVYEAIDVLIDRGIVHEQKNGVVYDEAGNVLMVDPTRCRFTVAELNADIARRGREHSSIMKPLRKEPLVK